MAKKQKTWQISTEVLDCIKKEYIKRNKKTKTVSEQGIVDERLRKAYGI